jgi:hypothetical protein
MANYDFAVLKGNKTITAAHSIALQDPRAAWPRVVALAQNVDEPGCRIRVSNEAGDVVILVGIDTDRRSLKASHSIKR